MLKECFISSSIGHNIVLGVFRTGVSLYHGTYLDTIPTESDWIATNPENSIIFCRGVDGNFWHLTLVAMRPLKVSYYTSAVETVSEGTLDIQRVGQVIRNRQLCDISRRPAYTEFSYCQYLCVQLLTWCYIPNDYVVNLHCVISQPVSRSYLSCISSHLGVKKGPGFTMIHLILKLVSILFLCADTTDLVASSLSAGIHRFEAMHAGSWHNR